MQGVWAQGRGRAGREGAGKCGKGGGGEQARGGLTPGGV